MHRQWLRPLGTVITSVPAARVPRSKPQARWVCPSCRSRLQNLHTATPQLSVSKGPAPAKRARPSRSGDKKPEAKPLSDKWDVTVGLEIHAQLNAKRKLFSYAATSFNAPPNSHVARFDAAIPGIQPKLTLSTILPALRAAVALECQINKSSSFDRKHYFYKDQPCGYQITQFYKPFASNGRLILNEFDGLSSSEQVEIGIQQVQMEQDTAKSIFQPATSDTPARTLIDLNRAGSGLVEIITTPSLKSSKQAAACLRKIQSILKASHAAVDGMEKGGIRCDVNISIQERGLPGLGRRVEIKNLNSIKAVQESIDAEVRRQIGIRENGGTVESETRGWDAILGESKRLRSKEGEIDYRYMPDAEIPPVVISDSLVEHVRSSLPQLPDQILTELTNEPYGLTLKDARTMVDHDDGARVEYYKNIYENLAIRSEPKVQDKHLGRQIANWVLHELGGRLALSFINWVDNPVSATQMADLISNLQLRVLTGASAKQLLDILISTKDPETQVHDLIATHDLATDSTSQEDADLVRLATEVVNEYPEKAEQVRSGKKPNLRNFFIGNLMRATGGKVDIQVCKQVIDRVFSDS